MPRQKPWSPSAACTARTVASTCLVRVRVRVGFVLGFVSGFVLGFVSGFVLGFVFVFGLGLNGEHLPPLSREHVACADDVEWRRDHRGARTRHPSSHGALSGRGSRAPLVGRVGREAPPREARLEVCGESWHGGLVAW